MSAPRNDFSVRLILHSMCAESRDYFLRSGLSPQHPLSSSVPSSRREYFMLTSRRFCLAVIPVVSYTVFAAFTPSVTAQSVTAICEPKITASREVATPAQRKAAGEIALPPLTDTSDGFAWPDTQLGVIKADGGYVFFGSDGGYHARQFWEGQYYGNNKYGSITRTIGTLDDPNGTEPPVDVTIRANPDPSVNPFYSSYDYMGGGPVYKVPSGMPGAGKLLMVYHAEIPTIKTQSFDSVFALALSSDGVINSTDLGEIVRINQDSR